MSGENEDLKKLLMQASTEAVDKMTEFKKEDHQEPFLVEEELTDKEIAIKRAIAIVEDGKNKWQLISEKMDGEFAARFMREMEAMNGKEFVRTYMKMLEYFKPKIHRSENNPVEQEDNVIRIEIHKSTPLKEDIIDITNKEE